jgi:acetoin utilization deacetylase AcuC-like enzyme
MASQTNDFALVRPPGHHAYRTRASGFCLFNNIAVAVQKLVNEDKRILIIDIDGHYGNGTADIFYTTNKVLYCSLHQYPAFPRNGFVNEIGEGEGKGFNINIPLPPSSGDDLFRDGCEIIFSIARMFKPNAVAVSAGFDAHHADPLLNLRLSANSFYWVGQKLRENFTNIFAVLEGGYNTDYLPDCVYNFINGINGDKIKLEENSTSSTEYATEEYQRRMKMLNQLTSEYW